MALTTAEAMHFKTELGSILRAWADFASIKVNPAEQDGQHATLTIATNDAAPIPADIQSQMQQLHQQLFSRAMSLADVTIVAGSKAQGLER